MASNDEILSTLKLWSSQGKLSQAKIEAGGLTLDGTVLENKTVTIHVDGKTIEYSLASIFLQIIDPSQGLVAYRNACKQNNVSDPVKALDKAKIVKYFVSGEGEAAAQGQDSTQQNSAAARSTEDAIAPPKPLEAEERSKDKEEGEYSQSRDKSSKSHHRTKDKKRDRKDHKQRDEPAKKKKPQEVTNEELFSNLSVVVEKRTAELDASRVEITKALSADGFEVTPELLEKHREAAQLIFENEIPVGNSASILRSANPRKDLSRVLQIFNETMNPPKQSSKSKRGITPTTKQTHQRPYLIGKKPVIVVPNGMTAPITLTNAQEFFQHGRFLPRDVAIKEGKAAARGATVAFSRQVRGAMGSDSLDYEIIDNPKKLGSDKREWERIVAVIALGQSWQFKDWLNDYANPVQLFSKTFGFFVSMDGDRIPQEVSSWSVKQAKLSRDKRGLDSVTFASFWNGLDNWMTVNRRELLPQSQDT